LQHESFAYPAPRTFPDDRVAKSVADERNRLGRLAPSIVERLKEMIANNPTLTEDVKIIILTDEVVPLW
jgi:hypothetical protein